MAIGMEEAEEMQVERMQEEVEGGGADTDKLSYEIFSILESKFLFGYTDPHQLGSQGLGAPDRKSVV